MSDSQHSARRQTARRAHGQTRWPAVMAIVLLLVAPACSLMATGGGDGTPQAPADNTQTELPPAVPIATESADASAGQRTPTAPPFLPPGLEPINPGNADRLRLVAELGATNVLLAQFAPDTGKLAAILVNENFRISGAGVWDLSTGQPLISLEGKAFEIAFSPDSRFLALLIPTQGIEVYDSSDGSLQSSLETDFNAAAYAPDWDRLAVSRYDDQAETSGVSMMQPASGSEIWATQTRDQLMAFEFSPDGDRLYGAVSLGPGKDGRLECWMVASGEACSVPPLSGLPVFSADGRLAAAPGSGQDGQSIEVYETESWRRVAAISSDGQAAYHPALTANGAIVGAQVGYRLRLWNAGTGQMLLELPNQIINFQFSPDGRLIAAWDSLGSLKLYGVTP